MKNSIKISLCLIILFSALGMAKAEKDKYVSNNSGSKVTAANKVTANCYRGTSSASLDINNVRAMVQNGGDMWWDLQNNAMYEVPKNNDPTANKTNALFAGGIWVGGISNSGQLLLASVTYRQNNEYAFWPGPIDTATHQVTANECKAFNRHWKVNTSEINDFYADFLDGRVNQPSDIPNNILLWPGYGNPHLANEASFGGVNLNRALAPFIDENNDGKYNPMDGDRPLTQGDQAIWWVMNDVGGTKVPYTQPIGLELQTMAFAYATQDVLNDMTFYKYTILNRGTEVMKNTYMAQWTDPDLGFAGDDFVGCDVPRGLGYCYNGDHYDEGTNGYGEFPPSIGVKFFGGPLSDANDGIDNDHDGLVDEIDFDPITNSFGPERIKMSNFFYYINNFNQISGVPNTAQDHYNYLRSRWKNGAPITHDLKYGVSTVDRAAGIFPTNYMFPGSSDLSYGIAFGGIQDSLRSHVLDTAGSLANKPWTEKTAGNTPGDRRFLQSAGPFTLMPGAKNEMTVAVIWAEHEKVEARPHDTLFYEECVCPIGLGPRSDRAQEEYDRNFKMLDGPNAPNLQITERDRELIFTLIPDEFRLNGKGPVINTETYEEYDGSIPSASDGSKTFKFEGYILYQLKDNTVTKAELTDPDKARVIYQTDVKNGISTIANYESLDGIDTIYNAQIMVNGADKGIDHTVKVGIDFFATGDQTLVNHKTYYYMAIAYAYNGNPKNRSHFLPGRFNIGDSDNGGKAYVATPHKNIGEVTNAVAGQKVNITRIYGVGNSMRPNVKKPERNTIKELNGSAKEKIFYDEGPFEVTIYDPLRVKNARMTLKMSSRLEYRQSTSNYRFKEGDIIRSVGNFTQDIGINDSGEIKTVVNRKIPQKAGLARIQRVQRRVDLSSRFSDTIVSLTVEMMNDEDHGTFSLLVEDYVKGPGNTGFVNLMANREIPQRFVLNSDPSKQAIATLFKLNDLYKLTSSALPEGSLYCNVPISHETSQVVADLGISIKVKRRPGPGYEPLKNPGNGNPTVSYEFENPEKQWLLPVTSDTMAILTMLPTAKKDDLPYNTPFGNADPQQVYTAFAIKNGWTPYALAEDKRGNIRPATLDGVTSVGRERSEARANMLYRLNNVDIVLTNDRSMWSRVPVLQSISREAIGSSISATYSLARTLKDTHVSVDINFQPDSTYSSYNDGLSTGMSYFPGYAIDVETGLRLNMAFMENRILDNTATDIDMNKVYGADMRYNPNSNPDGGGNVIYVTNTPYDEGKSFERAYDSIVSGVSVNDMSAKVASLYNSTFTWAGLLRTAVGYRRGEIPTTTTVKLRVDKLFRSYGEGENNDPEYFFSTEGMQAQFHVKEKIADELGLIRIVPNPYYAYSSYETSQTDGRVKIINLPSQCVISIYAMGGTLVKQFRKNDDLTFVDWDMRNLQNTAVGSGAYIVHINAAEINQQKVLKFFMISRSSDLDAF